MIRVEKRDSEPTVRNKVHEAFPLVFSKGESMQFQFLSAKSRSLADVAPQDLGYATWTGDAVTALAGQGCLYVLPLHSSVKSKKKATVNVLSPNITALHSLVTVPGMGISLTTTTTNTTAAFTSGVPMSSASAMATSISESKILTAVNDPFIGGYILELAGLKRYDYQDDQIEENESGSKLIKLSAVNCDVLQWLSWRKSKGQVLENPYKPGSLFVKCSDTELNDFFGFRDASRHLDAISDCYYIQYSKPLEAILAKLEIAAKTVTRYNDKYFTLPFNDILTM